MANNSNLKGIRYVGSDLAKQKVVPPPRNKRLEKSLYFYKTAETVVDVENSTTNSKVISATFDKEIPLKSTTPLQFDFGKPKYPALSDSQTWASQINGFVYEEIDVNTDLYNFMSFSLLQDGTIAQSEKYRVVDYHPFYKDGTGTFMYATIVLVRDTGKTIPGFDRISWRLSNKLIFDSKTKYIKAVFPPTTQLFPQGIKVSVEDDRGIRKDTGFSVNACTDLTFKFIKVRGTSPYAFDDMTYKNFQDKKISGAGESYRGPQPNGSGLIEWLNESPLPGSLAPKAYPSGIKVTQNSVDANVGGIDIDSITSAIDDYFTKGAFKISGRGNSLITQKDITPNILTSWLSGNTIFGNEIVPVGNDDLTIENAESQVSDLDRTNENDRKYFVITKKTDMTKIGLGSYRDTSFDNTATKRKFLFIDKLRKLTLINKESTTKYFQEPDEEITLEMELTTAGKNALLDLETTLADDVKISTYDENHKLLLDSVSIETEFKFNNAKRLTKIQL